MNERANKKDVWKYLIDIYGKNCVYCGCELDIDNCSIDHINPTSKGWGTYIENLVPSCKECNESKGNESIDRFREFFPNKVFAIEQKGFSFVKNKGMFILVSNELVKKEDGENNEEEQNKSINRFPSVFDNSIS